MVLKNPGGRAEAKGEDANEFALYGLTFKHKHLPELQKFARLLHTPLFQPAVGNFRQGMITAVPLQLWTLPKVPTGSDLHAAEVKIGSAAAKAATQK